MGIEKRFLHEFVNALILAEKSTQETKKEITVKEMLREAEKKVEEKVGEKTSEVRLITRQFVPFSESIKTQTIAPVVKTETPPKIAAIKPILTDTAIDSFINDASIRLIELSDGTIKIKRNGEFENSGVSLSSQDAKKIIDKFSLETRIPAISGVFKASLQDLTINAILSDAMNPRFIIIRKK